LCLSCSRYDFYSIESNWKAIFAVFQIDGNGSKEDVFAQIDGWLTKLLEQRKATSESLAA